MNGNATNEGEDRMISFDSKGIQTKPSFKDHTIHYSSDPYDIPL